jgi:hypothetical protein
MAEALGRACAEGAVQDVENLRSKWCVTVFLFCIAFWIFVFALVRAL